MTFKHLLLDQTSNPIYELSLYINELTAWCTIIALLLFHLYMKRAVRMCAYYLFQIHLHFRLYRNFCVMEYSSDNKLWLAPFLVTCHFTGLSERPPKVIVFMQAIHTELRGPKGQRD